MPTKEITYFAHGIVGYHEEPIGILRPDRRFHFYTIGRTGTGKSTMLENMIAQDLAAGHGLALIDPHGDLAERVLLAVPRYRRPQLIYFNPADIDFPVGLNVLARVPAHGRHLVASSVISIFKKLWADSWGPRMNYLLHNALLALLETPESTLLSMVRLLSDERYRQKVVKRVTDPLVRHYWEKEFATFPPRLLPEILSPVQNKIGAYLTHQTLRNILAQSRSAIDFGEVMNNHGILIVNLGKGRIGEEAANLLGSLIVTKLQLAAMARASMPEEQRHDFYCYVDEFHNFTTESFADILAEARKYRLNLVLAHQYLGQLDERLRQAVLANAGTLVCFRVGPEDAKMLAHEFEPQYSWLELTNLSPHQVCYKVTRNGIVKEPGLAVTFAPGEPNAANAKTDHDEIVAESRRRYGRPRIQVERMVNQFFGQPYPSGIVSDNSTKRW